MEDRADTIKDVAQDERKMDAKRSVLVFLLYYIVQFLTGLIAGALISVSFVIFTGHRPDEQEFEMFTRTLDPYILLASSIISALFLIYFTFHYVPRHLKDRSIYGFAVHPGNSTHLISSLLAGLLVAFVYALSITMIFPPGPETQFGPITEMVFTEGVTRIIWLVLALMVAPPVEEYLFRGILFAGFTRSFGLYPSVVLTTFIFSVIHLSEYIFYPPAMIGIVALGFLTVILRIKTRSLGPPVAAHFGYNLLIAIMLLNSVQ